MTFLCVHGHFYQPPRESPWTGEIAPQVSAAPYHDWNERINAECYAVNAGLPDAGGTALRLPNYPNMSFDFGPTLLSWLETRAPLVYRSILEADRDSRARFSGHGSALAQAYNHMILPLANRRDKQTQVRWGIRDFEHRFGRSPEGMWLPETAVDNETLEILARESIRYTVLAPHQAARWRSVGEATWNEVPTDGIDPRRSYETRLRSGHRLAILFYDGPLSHAIAFGALGAGPESLARLFAAASSGSPAEGLVAVATDGETYGHHHRLGAATLAQALDAIVRAGAARLTNFGEYLSEMPPSHEIEVRENTSWSCAHGVGRWALNCGCQTGEHPAWTQAWRAPLRAALDWLRDRLAVVYEKEAGELFADPWCVRDESVEIWLGETGRAAGEFVARHARRPLQEAEIARGVSLLRMQREAMFMYTSCGWFFDDVGGLEGAQILQHAARAIELAGSDARAVLEEPFLTLLEQASSNVPERGNARRVYEAFNGALNRRLAARL